MRSCDMEAVYSNKTEPVSKPAKHSIQTELLTEEVMLHQSEQTKQGGLQVSAVAAACQSHDLLSSLSRTNSHRPRRQGLCSMREQKIRVMSPLQHNNDQAIQHSEQPELQWERLP